MDGGYSLFYSVMKREKYLGFNRNGKPFNYGRSLEDPLKIDKQCRKIFIRKNHDSSNGLSTSTIDYEQTSSAYSNNLNNNNNNNHNHNHRHKSSTRKHQKTHSNRIEASKSRSTSAHTSKRNKSQQQHHVRHHHDQLPLRHHDTISYKDNKDIDSNDNMSSTKQLGNEDLNAIYNHNDSGVNIESDGKGKQAAHNRNHKKPTQSVSKLSKGEHNLDQKPGSSSHNKNNPNPTNDNLGKDETNNDTNNCTYSTKNTEDETDDKSVRGRKIVKGRNTAYANDKPNNKCNNNNRRHRKNNENGRHSRKPSQRSSSHKNQQANP